MPKVLIVDDCPLTRLGTVLCVEHLGYQTDQAFSGQHALDQIQNTAYKLILMDYQKPGMDRIECSNKIREMEIESGQRAAIFLFTSSSELGLLEKCFEADIDGYLNKNCPVDQLNQTVNTWAGQVSTSI